MDKREVYRTDEELRLQLMASGIDMTVIPLETMIKYVRGYWDLYVLNNEVEDESLLRFGIRVETKESECYYENVIAAVSTGDEKFVNLFLATGFVPSEEQKEEMEEYRRARHHNKPRLLLTPNDK
jgi:hypothetical protein